MQVNRQILIWAGIGIAILVVLISFILLANRPQQPAGVAVNTPKPLNGGDAAATSEAENGETTEEATEEAEAEETAEAASGEDDAAEMTEEVDTQAHDGQDAGTEGADAEATEETTGAIEDEETSQVAATPTSRSRVTQSIPIGTQVTPALQGVPQMQSQTGETAEENGVATPTSLSRVTQSFTLDEQTTATPTD